MQATLGVAIRNHALAILYTKQKANRRSYSACLTLALVPSYHYVPLKGRRKVHAELFAEFDFALCIRAATG